MFIFQRKNKNVGEIHVVLTKDDRVEHLIEGTRWINMNECLNDFNKDPDITEAKLTAVYAGDIDRDSIAGYISGHLVDNSNKKSENKKPKNAKVDNDGKVVHDDEEEEKEKDSELKECLSGLDLECPKCGDVKKALIDSEGNIKPCEGCMKIDSYIKGKIEAYKQIYEYLSDSKNNKDIVDDLLKKLQEELEEENNLLGDEDLPEITRGE